MWHLLAYAMYVNGKGHCWHAYDCRHDEVACSYTRSHQLAECQHKLRSVLTVPAVGYADLVSRATREDGGVPGAPHRSVTPRHNWQSRLLWALCQQVWCLADCQHTCHSPLTPQEPSYHHDSVFSRRHGSKHTPQADISHSVFSGKQQHPVQSQAALSCSSHNHVQPGLLQALCLVKTKLRAAPLRGYFYDG